MKDGIGEQGRGFAGVRRGVHQYLSEKGMFYGDIDFSQVVDAFLGEMERGLKGSESSLAMIPTYVEAGRELPVGEKSLVLDAGGTNLRAAAVSFNGDGKPEISYFKKYSMPGKEREVSRAEFFSTLADYLEPASDQSGRLGFCFSYPMDKTPEKDGIPHPFSKQIQAPEVVGSLVGKTLAETLAARGKPLSHRPVLLNDTVATLLTGMSASLHRNYSTYIGFILGTGVNAGYVEQNREITKADHLDSQGSMIINMESGGFSGPPRGEWDRLFDATTLDEGRYVFEKMMSGAYFGRLCTVSLQAAAGDGLFSPAANRILGDIREPLATPDADRFLHNPADPENRIVQLLAGVPGENRDEDSRKVYHILDALMERAAMMAAVNLAGVVMKTGQGTDPLSPVCITADGTTFYKNKDFPHRVHRWLRPYLLEEHGRFYEVIKVEDAPLVGAAIAGLTN